MAAVDFSSRPEAEAAELSAIRDEAPVYNVVTADADGCARFLPRQGTRRWGRQAWKPRDDSQQSVLAGLEMAAQRTRSAEAAMWKAILAARNADVPDTVLCERTKQSRATLNRRYGSRRTGEGGE